MSNEPERQAELEGPGLDACDPALRTPRVGTPEPSPLDGRGETQLRARVAELEAQLVEIARCLEDSEARAADAVALRADFETVMGTLRRMEASRSWRLTRPMRSAIGRLRGRRSGSSPRA